MDTKERTWLISIYGAVSYLLGIAIGFLAGSSAGEPADLIYTQGPLVIYKDHDSLALENVRYEIERAKIVFPEIVEAQVIYETGHLKCRDCSLDDNNLFGLQHKEGEYLKFDTWMQSVWFIKDWQRRNYKGGDYYECLRKKWGAKDMDQYIKTIKRIEKKIE